MWHGLLPRVGVSSSVEVGARERAGLVLHTLAPRLTVSTSRESTVQLRWGMDGFQQALHSYEQGHASARAGVEKPPDADVRADGGPTASISGKRTVLASTGAKGAAGKAGGCAKAPEATARLVEVQTAC